MSNEETKNELRRNAYHKMAYTKLIYKAENLKERDHEINETSLALSEILDEANSLFSEIKYSEDRTSFTNVTLLDSQLMSTTSDVVYKVSKSVDVNIDSYNAKQFINQIYTNFNLNEKSPLDSPQLINKAHKIIQPCPSYKTMYGFTVSQKWIGSIVPVNKPARTRNKHDKFLKDKLEIVYQDEEMEKSVDDTIKFIYWALKKEYESNGNKPVNYLHFVLNPINFNKTIENMFNVSFLITDGKASLTEEDALVLSPISTKDKEELKNDDGYNQQFIVTLNAAEWEGVVKVVQETQKTKFEQSVLEKWRKVWDIRNRKKGLS